LCLIVAVSDVRAAERIHIITDGGRACANAMITLNVPAHPARQSVDVSIRDPWNQTIWSGCARGETFNVHTRDWADGMYTVTFAEDHTQTLYVNSELFGKVRARCGVMLRYLETKRDPDGLVPKELAGVSNLLQRIMTLFVWSLPEDHLEGQLYHCEQQLGFRTRSATARILGSGASEFLGYDDPCFPGRRERSSMFVPPNAVVDFGEHNERKLKRWGYGIEDVEHILISHNHADHFHAQAIKVFAAKRIAVGLKPVTMYAGKASCDDLRAILTADADRASVVVHEVKPGDRFKAGEIEVEVVRATHTLDSSPHGYIMTFKSATIYYGTDSGYPQAATLAALSKHRFDIFAHDFTVISGDDGVTHSDLGDMLLLIGKLRRAGALDPWTRFIALHQGFEGPQTAPDREFWQSTMAFETTYDGMPLPIAWRVDLRP
jgi:L-ascorbate metabolism protein UlaG (beta-lactamase superfamily)